jgi:hypothetical protein
MTDETTPQDSEAMSPASAGSHGEPVAWGVATSGGFVVYAMRTRSEAARYVADETNIVPLYRSPTLTDDEREALEAGISLCEGVAGEANENANANAWAKKAGRLRELLDRLK